MSCISCLGAPEQQHQLTPISWMPDLSTTVMIGCPSLSLCPGFELPKLRWASVSSSELLPSWHSSSSSLFCDTRFRMWFKTQSCCIRTLLTGHKFPECPRHNLIPTSRSHDGMKYFPVHF